MPYHPTTPTHLKTQQNQAKHPGTVPEPFRNRSALASGAAVSKCFAVFRHVAARPRASYDAAKARKTAVLFSQDFHAGRKGHYQRAGS